MNNNLQAFEVSKNDPYFTADKWNETLNYSKCFEKMISGILGNKFKGIYKPFEKYNLYDYVWFNNDYYQIIEEKANTVELLEKENYNNFYYNCPGNYIGINNNKKIVNIIDQNEYELSNLEFDNFYLFGDELIAIKNENLYKINIITKITKPINYIFSRKIKDVKKDKFQIYMVSDKCIEVGNSINDDLTETKVLYNSDINISDIAINEHEILVLKNNNIVDIINKSNGQLISSFEITQHIEHSKVKILSPDNYSLIIYDGTQLIMFFNNNGQYVYSGNAKNAYLSYGVTSLTNRNGYICATNNAGATTYLANRYNLEKVNISSLLINNVNIDKSFVDEYIDYSKGQFETEKLKPEYTKISAVNDKGLNITDNFSYNFNNFLNKSIQVNIECSKQLKEKICSIYIGAKLCEISIDTQIGKNIFFVDFEETSYRLTTFNGDVKTVETFNYSSSTTQNKIVFNSKSGYILNSFIIFNSIIPFHKKDYFRQNSIQSFDIQPSIKSYPFSYVKTDEDGNININIVDQSILKNEKGYKVNLSDKLTDSNIDVGLNLKGAKTLWDKVVSEVNRLTNSLAPKSHRHEWQEIDSIPSATTSNKGIVQLSNSVIGSSETTAASEKAVKISKDAADAAHKRGDEAYNKANHEHPYLNNSGGTVNGNVTINGQLNSNSGTIGGALKVNGNIDTNGLTLSSYRITIG